MSVKCLEILPGSEHKSFDLKHVLTLVVLSKVWNGAPLVSVDFQLGPDPKSNIFCIFYIVYFMYTFIFIHLYFQCPHKHPVIHYIIKRCLISLWSSFRHFSPQPELCDFTPLRRKTFSSPGRQCFYLEDRIWGTCRVIAFLLSKTVVFDLGHSPSHRQMGQACWKTAHYLRTNEKFSTLCMQSIQ